MRAPSDHFALHVVSLVVISLGAGCAGNLAAAPAAVQPTQTSASSPGTDVVHIVGLLTLKGSEIDAWWALTDDSGVVWLLEASNRDQASLFRQWQNRRLTVDGVRTGAVLSTPRVRVEGAQLVP